MEKRKWDVNSISVIQFSCEIKRKARIWEIWKLQLQDKWYLKGSYLIWLNWSSNVTREMHCLQVFQGLVCASQAVLTPNLGRDVRGHRLGGGLGWEESWVLLRGGSMFYPVALDAGLLGLHEVFRVHSQYFHKKMHLLLNPVLCLEVFCSCHILTSEWQWEFGFAAASSGFFVLMLSIFAVVRWCPVVGSVWQTWSSPAYCVLPAWCHWPAPALGWLLLCTNPFSPIFCSEAVGWIRILKPFEGKVLDSFASPGDWPMTSQHGCLWFTGCASSVLPFAFPGLSVWHTSHG